jgi:hypothetical protein
VSAFVACESAPTHFTARQGRAKADLAAAGLCRGSFMAAATIHSYGSMAKISKCVYPLPANHLSMRVMDRCVILKRASTGERLRSLGYLVRIPQQRTGWWSVRPDDAQSDPQRRLLPLVRQCKKGSQSPSLSPSLSVGSVCLFQACCNMDCSTRDSRARS